MSQLTCDMQESCESEITHVDNKGWLYCDHHGAQRNRSTPCRKLQAGEITRLENGQTISWRPAGVMADWYRDIDKRVEETIND